MSLRMQSANKITQPTLVASKPWKHEQCCHISSNTSNKFMEIFKKNKFCSTVILNVTRIQHSALFKRVMVNCIIKVHVRTSLQEQWGLIFSLICLKHSVQCCITVLLLDSFSFHCMLVVRLLFIARHKISRTLNSINR